jgi:hypothetical protein
MDAAPGKIGLAGLLRVARDLVRRYLEKNSRFCLKSRKQTTGNFSAC